MHQAKNLWPSLSRETAWLLPGNLCKGFPGGPVVKNPPAMQKTQQVWVWSLSHIDPLEEEMATHSSILAWKISWTEEPGGLQSMGSQRVGHDWATSLTHSLRDITNGYKDIQIIFSFHSHATFPSSESLGAFNFRSFQGSVVQFIFLFSALFDLSHMREPEFWLRTKTKVWRQSQRNGAHGRIQKMNKSKRVSATRGIIISKVTIFVYFLCVSPLKKTVFWNSVMKRSSSSLCWSQAMSWGRVKAIYEEWFQGQRSGGCRKVKKCVQALGLRSTAMWGWRSFNFMWLLI